MVEQDEETTLAFVWGQGDYREKLSTAADKVISLYWENAGSRCHTNASIHQNNFKLDRAIFITARVRDIFNNFREMESTYTVFLSPSMMRIRRITTAVWETTTLRCVCPSPFRTLNLYP